MNAVLSRNASRTDHRAIHARQQSAWASGDYAAVGDVLQIVSEELCETVKLCQDERVLDVATGTFHASHAAARRWCEVTAAVCASDMTPRTSARMETEALGVRFVDGDAEALPFADQSFDAVVSAFGTMFAVDQERAASEMIRVVRRGRRIGLANWTPDGFIGQLFSTVARHMPAGSSGASPFLWGTTERLEELFGAYGPIWATRKQVTLRSRTPMDWVDKLRSTYLPVQRAFTLLDADRKRAMRAELLELVARFNRAKDGTMLVDSAYLEVVISRR
jgi:SAM-dependent methyltransferase